jgi:hypothetical protein
MDVHPESVSTNPPLATPVFDFEKAWGVALQPMLCERCDWGYLVSPGTERIICPHCFQAALTPLHGESAQLAYNSPPELFLPFQVSQDALAKNIQSFTQGIPFAPGDLTPDNLRRRLVLLYLPSWLVDSSVEGTWQAEAGYNYEVVSHQDHFDQGRNGWTSRQVKEQRVRWESRLGSLKRDYQNIPTPALEDYGLLQSALGGYSYKPASTYQPAALENTLVRTPDRTPQDAWGDARHALQSAAAEDCRKASAADHIRQFSWQPSFKTQNWSLLLLPVISSYYMDDEGRPQRVLINGQSGRVSGSHLASMKRGRRLSLILLAIALTIFVISLLSTVAGALLPILFPVGALGLFVAFLLALGAIIPVAIVWAFNRTQKSARG